MSGIMTRAIRLVLCCSVTLAAGSAQARVAAISLGDLARNSAIIGIVRVDQIRTVNGWRIATATIQTPIANVNAGQTVTFIAEPTWTCDTSGAVLGEQTLLFLTPLDRRFAAQTEGLTGKGGLNAAQDRLAKDGKVLYEITHSGRGRIPFKGVNSVPSISLEKPAGGRAFLSRSAGGVYIERDLLAKLTRTDFISLNAIADYSRQAWKRAR
jgi:hypothetical protein